jgi:hypothetical protein
VVLQLHQRRQSTNIYFPSSLNCVIRKIPKFPLSCATSHNLHPWCHVHFASRFCHQLLCAISGSSASSDKGNPQTFTFQVLSIVSLERSPNFHSSVPHTSHNLLPQLLKPGGTDPIPHYRASLHSWVRFPIKISCECSNQSSKPLLFIFGDGPCWFMSFARCYYPTKIERFTNF